MTRRRALLALVALAILAAVAVGRDGDRQQRSYHVNAVFDNGRGVLPGGLVKIAGATVGSVEDIKLTADRKALVRMRVDKDFAPFRADAHCSIRGEGLVGAAVINCQPGTPDGAELGRGADSRPTLPLDRTSIPVSITDFFEIWQAPTRDRLRILLDELGIALSGRGDDLNHLLRRVNPALGKAQRVLKIIADQRRRLARSITDSNRAIGELAADAPATRRFIAEAARTSELTAAHAPAIAAGIAGLPPLLRRSRDALDEIDALNHASVPVFADLEAAAPNLERLTADTPPFARLALPSIRALKPALRSANATVRELGPFVRGLQRFTKEADTAGRLQSSLFVSLRDSGAFESLLRLFYVGAASMSRYDAIAHVDPSHLLATTCATYATTPEPGCSAHYVEPKAPAAKRRRAARRPARQERAPSRAQPTAPSAPAVRIPALPDKLDGTVGRLLDYLLGQ